MDSTPDDTTTIEAIRVLAKAVHRERVPGVVEFGQLERALDTAAAAPSEENLALAGAAFEAIDADFRQRIVDTAHRLAHDVAGQRRTGLDAALEAVVNAAPAAPAPPPPERRPRTPHRHASPLLGALNRNRG